MLKNPDIAAALRRCLAVIWGLERLSDADADADGHAIFRVLYLDLVRTGKRSNRPRWASAGSIRVGLDHAVLSA